ncbi:hypothetical protein DPMN_167032 [Dreissena polymorpha]|uniref:Uncharacterized protein n=1 Tax=Dreissena polymorpha TaxID=45954 RepID=A0A9D4IXX8_DREPO|nr:hypothetical protein DPMN_167032 [Dreissena polymorpha]
MPGRGKPAGRKRKAQTQLQKKNQETRVFNAENDPPGGNETHVLTQFHEDSTKHVTSTVFTCFHYIHIEKTAPPPGGHVFSPVRTNLNSSEISIKTINTTPPPGGHTNILTKYTWPSFKLSRGINGKNVLTKFHEDRTINVASKVCSQGKMLTPNDARRTKGDEHVVLSKAHIQLLTKFERTLNTDRQTDRPTDQPTYRPTDKFTPIYPPKLQRGHLIRTDRQTDRQVHSYIRS